MSFQSGRRALLQFTLQDITTRKQAEMELARHRDLAREAEKRLALVLNTVPQAIFWKDCNSVYLGCNAVFAKAVGLDSSDKITGKTDYDLPWPHAEAEAYRVDDREVMEHNHPKLHIIEPLQQADGMRLWIDTTKLPLMDDGGRVFGVLGVYEDITERKRLSEDILAEKRFSDAIINSLPGLFYVMDETGRMMKWNSNLEILSGYSSEEIAGMNALQFVSQESTEAASQAIREVFNTGESRGVEATFLSKDRKEIPCLFTGRRVQLPVGGWFLCGMAIDISQRKMAEEKLAHSHNLMRYIIEHTNSAVAVHDRDLRYIYVSQRYLDQYKVKEQDVIGKDHYDVFPDLPQKWRDVHKRALLGEVVSADRDPYDRADGTIDWTRWECRPWYEADGRIGGIIVYTEVITESVRNEEALKQVNLVVENSPVVLFRWRATKGWPVAMVSQNVTQFGYTPQELLSGAVPFGSMVHPEDLDRVSREVQEYSVSGADHFQQEYRILTKDGEVRWVDDRTMVERNVDGQVTSYEGSVIDITERKRAEMALRKSEERFRQIAENSQVWIWEVDAHGLFTYASQMVQEILGYTPEELVGKKYFYDLFCPEDREPLKRASLNVFKSRQRFRDYINRNMRKDGATIWLSTSGVPILDEHGALLGYRGADANVTERKQVEEALRESETRFRSIVESSPMAQYFYHLESDGQLIFIGANPSADRIIGISHHSLLGKTIEEAFPNLCHTEIPKMYRKVAKGEIGPQTFEISYQDNRLSGFYDVSVFKTGPMNIAVDFLDISERKQAEAELARHRDRLEELVKERTAELEKEIAERKQAEQRIQAALAEKEVLLREVHHRVKNNLNTIANILYFQAKTLEDKKALAAFKDSENRIHSMARIHEHLYSSPSLTQINMVSYFKDLTADLQQTFGSKPIAIHIDASKKHLEIDQAIPCGLIVNELVTNSLKYAFPEGTTNSRKELSIRLTTQADQHILEVRDNGVGLPPGLDVKNSPSLGLRLVSMLTRQLKGRLTIDTAPGKGVKFTVNFPVAITEDPNEKP